MCRSLAKRETNVLEANITSGRTELLLNQVKNILAFQ